MIRAAAYGQVKDFDSAIEDYSAVLAARPDDLEAIEARGVARLFAEKAEGAEDDFTAILAATPGNERVSLFRVSARFAQQKYEKAEQDFDVVLMTFPNDADTRLNRGLARLARGRPLDAIADFTVALESEPDLMLAKRRRGQAQVLAGKFAEALEDFDTLKEQRPVDAVWRFIAAKRTHRADADAELQRRAQDIDPTVWPGALIDGLEGQVPVDTVMREALLDPQEAKARMTETQFALGQLALAAEQTDLARTSFMAAVATGSVELIEYQGAVLELKRLSLQ